MAQAVVPGALYLPVTSAVVEDGAQGQLPMWYEMVALYGAGRQMKAQVEQDSPEKQQVLVVDVAGEVGPVVLDEHQSDVEGLDDFGVVVQPG